MPELVILGRMRLESKFDSTQSNWGPLQSDVLDSYGSDTLQVWSEIPDLSLGVVTC